MAVKAVNDRRRPVRFDHFESLYAIALLGGIAMLLIWSLSNSLKSGQIRIWNKLVAERSGQPRLYWSWFFARSSFAVCAAAGMILVGYLRS